MTDRLFAGLIVMRKDTAGQITLVNELYNGWAPTEDAIREGWIKHATALRPDHAVSYQAVYDITDVVRERMIPKDRDAASGSAVSGDREPGFYWVLPIFDVDGDADAWHQKEQPAHWDGEHWTMLGVEDEAWQPIWVGERIAPVDGRS